MPRKNRLLFLVRKKKKSQWWSEKKLGQDTLSAIDYEIHNVADGREAERALSLLVNSARVSERVDFCKNLVSMMATDNSYDLTSNAVWLCGQLYSTVPNNVSRLIRLKLSGIDLRDIHITHFVWMISALSKVNPKLPELFKSNLISVVVESELLNLTIRQISKLYSGLCGLEKSFSDKQRTQLEVTLEKRLLCPSDSHLFRSLSFSTASHVLEWLGKCAAAEKKNINREIATKISGRIRILSGPSRVIPNDYETFRADIMTPVEVSRILWGLSFSPKDCLFDIEPAVGILLRNAELIPKHLFSPLDVVLILNSLGRMKNNNPAAFTYFGRLFARQVRLNKEITTTNITTVLNAYALSRASNAYFDAICVELSEKSNRFLTLKTPNIARAASIVLRSSVALNRWKGFKIIPITTSLVSEVFKTGGGDLNDLRRVQETLLDLSSRQSISDRDDDTVKLLNRLTVSLSHKYLMDKTISVTQRISFIRCCSETCQYPTPFVMRTVMKSLPRVLSSSDLLVILNCCNKVEGLVLVFEAIEYFRVSSEYSDLISLCEIINFLLEYQKTRRHPLISIVLSRISEHSQEMLSIECSQSMLNTWRTLLKQKVVKTESLTAAFYPAIRSVLRHTLQGDEQKYDRILQMSLPEFVQSTSGGIADQHNSNSSDRVNSDSGSSSESQSEHKSIDSKKSSKGRTSDILTIQPLQQSNQNQTRRPPRNKKPQTTDGEGSQTDNKDVRVVALSYVAKQNIFPSAAIQRVITPTHQLHNSKHHSRNRVLSQKEISAASDKPRHREVTTQHKKLSKQLTPAVRKLSKEETLHIAVTSSLEIVYLENGPVREGSVRLLDVEQLQRAAFKLIPQLEESLAVQLITCLIRNPFWKPKNQLISLIYELNITITPSSHTNKLYLALCAWRAYQESDRALIYLKEVMSVPSKVVATGARVSLRSPVSVQSKLTRCDVIKNTRVLPSKLSLETNSVLSELQILCNATLA